MRQAIEAHRGEAYNSYIKWTTLGDVKQNSVIEFLKTLQILPEGTPNLVIDERGKSKKWP